ncbi:MAG TPA: hypothetical protein VJI96_04160 [Candidatus Andersenbacteria bacterium]|nr:hypothetical protein [Candidatus Andersenbacteria bacterium]
MVSFQVISKTVLYFFFPLFVFGLSSISGISKYTLHIALLCFIVAIALSFVKNAKLALIKTSINSLLILLLVGATGWFLSPFFFLLYLLPMYLGFLYVPSVAFGFLAALLIIFSFSVGDEVNLSFDIMTLLSLLLVIPLVIYLRKKFLILKQTDKDILILEEESGIKDTDTIATLLANRVTNLGVTIRQPLSFIKQAATVLIEEDLSPKEATEYLKRIRSTAAESLKDIRDFEGDTSANEVLENSTTKSPETFDFAGGKELKKVKKPRQ